MSDNLQYSPRRIFEYLEAASEEWAESQLEYDQINKSGEILLSELVLAARDAGHPIGICKDVARTRPEWRTHVTGEVIARNKAQRARAKYHNMQAWAEAMRTAESTSRALTTRPMP